MMKSFWLSLVLVLACVGNSVAQTLPVFDVTRYGAIPNDAIDDTTAIDNALDAAAAQTALAIQGSDLKAEVIFPRGVYIITTLSIEHDRLVIRGNGSTLTKGANGSETQLVNFTSASEDCELNDLTIDGQWEEANPTYESSGAGSGLQMSGTRTTCRNVRVVNVEGAGIIDAALAWENKLYNCYTENTGTNGYRTRGDWLEVHNCEMVDWNMVDPSGNAGNTGFLVDSTQYDADSLFVDGFKIRQTTALLGGPAIKVDAGDHAATSVSTHLEMGNGGAATNYRGKAQFTIDRGHGYRAGDGFLIQSASTGIAEYDNLSHKIISSTGAVYARVESSMTFTLHNTSASAVPYDFTITDDGADEVTVPSSFPGETGDPVRIYTTAPTGLSIGTTYYVNMTSSTTATFHPTEGDATGDTNKIAITGADTYYVASDAEMVDLVTSVGSGTMYVKCVGSPRRSVTLSAGSVSLTTNTMTTDDAHGFRNGAEARLTPDATADVLPGGLSGMALITLNTDFTSAGTSGNYARPKRYRNLTLRNVHIIKYPGTANNHSAVKIANVSDTFLDRWIVSNPAQATDTANLQLAGNIHKLTARDCRFGNFIRNNRKSWLTEIDIDGCTIGGGDIVPDYAIEDLSVGRFSMRNSTVRFRTAAIRTSDTDADFRDADCEYFDIKNNVFEAVTSSRGAVFSRGGTYHMSHSGMLRYYGNVRRNVGGYAGLGVGQTIAFTITDDAGDEITTASTPSASTGDTVHVFNEGGGLPTNLVADTAYYVREDAVNSDEFTFHPTETDADNNTNKIAITGGTGAQYIVFGPIDTSTDVCTSNLHTLETGDAVNLSATILPTVVSTALTTTTPYYIRRLSPSTYTLHRSRAGASDGTDVIDITDGGTSVVLLSDKVGCQFTGNQVFDQLWYQKNGNGTEYVATETPLTSTSVEHHLGDIIWNMNQEVNEPLGWVCTKSGALTSTQATFTAISTQSHRALSSSTTEVGNVGSGADTLMSYTIPANTLIDNGDAVVFDTGFTFAANGNSKRVQITFDAGTVVYDVTSAQNGGTMQIRVLAVRDSATTAKLSVQVLSGDGTGTPFPAYGATVLATGLDFTDTTLIKGTGTSTGAPADNDIVQEFLQVRYMPAP